MKKRQKTKKERNKALNKGFFYPILKLMVHGSSLSRWRRTKPNTRGAWAVPCPLLRLCLKILVPSVPNFRSTNQIRPTSVVDASCMGSTPNQLLTKSHQEPPRATKGHQGAPRGHANSSPCMQTGWRGQRGVRHAQYIKWWMALLEKEIHAIDPAASKL